ncbi:hypothetical protein [Peribacillus glennii]|uniref:Uncharacterized protein n=1 Tax=Peribacillus glennii TaxID=2303991 RepID=A0A372LG31_9BACI|nr:hypothetical protein [Peribacillus glennii]RFU65258.1 hypothetical protein D0466_04985 [Peribacillus glennii]
MENEIVKVLEGKNIKVPEHHIQPLMAQWQGYLQLKKNVDAVKHADFDIGLKHVPGGDRQ